MRAWIVRAAGRRPLLAYLVLAFTLTWAGSGVYLLTLPRGGRVLPPIVGVLAIIPWYFGPALAALIVTGLTEGRAGIRRLLGAYRIWRVGWGWPVFIVLYPVLLHLAVIGLRQLWGGPGIHFFRAEGVPQGSVVGTLAQLILFHTLVRGLGEETGWRGFALPRLKARRSALTASLMLGVVWALWHIHPTNLPTLSTLNGVFTLLSIVGTAVVFTFVYNGTSGSLLYAALFHMTLNVVEYVIPTAAVSEDVGAAAIQLIVVWLFVGALVLLFGPELELRKGRVR